MLRERACIPPDRRAALSRKITARITEHPFFQEAAQIFCYVSFREEVETEGILQAAWASGKRTAVPKVTGQHSMEFFYIDSMDELEPGYQGILEPVTDRRAVVKNGDESAVLLIMPGAAFDRNGYRIGYGGGYYDAYLERYPDCRRIAAAFELQMLENLPVKAHDRKVDAVITEERCYTC